jgi:probable HAF family extracellular repeat protein
VLRAPLVIGFSLAIGTFALATRAAAQPPPLFTLVGTAPGTLGSYLYGLSADGRVAAGYSVSDSALPNPAFTWTAAGGRVDFGLEAGLPRWTIAYGISGDASTVVGESLSRSQVDNQAFRWTGTGTYQTLGALPDYQRSAAYGVSGDGSVVVGRSSRGTNDSLVQAFRWTASTGMQGLGFTQGSSGVQSESKAVSRDGGTIVGYSETGQGRKDAFVWTQSTGMRALPQLPGAPAGTSLASGVNFDGSLIVGFSGPTAAMWRNGQPIDLGLPSGFNGGNGRAVSDDGSVVVGLLYDGSLQAAGIWTAARGPETLASYLAANGVAIPAGWTPWAATCVSADGLTIGGWAHSSTGAQGFIAIVPAPGGAMVLGLGAVCAGRRRRAGTG